MSDQPEPLFDVGGIPTDVVVEVDRLITEIEEVIDRTWDLQYVRDTFAGNLMRSASSKLDKLKDALRRERELTRGQEAG